MTTDRDRQDRFLAAYDKIHDGFIRYCTAASFGRMPLEDLVQDCLLSAYQHFDELAEPEKLQGYLIRVARNRSVSVWRSKKYAAALTQVQCKGLSAKGATAEELADVSLLYRAIHKLSTGQRDAILLYEISGYPQCDVAEQLGCTTAAVKMLLQRARKNLKRQLTDPGRDVNGLLRTAKSIAL